MGQTFFNCRRGNTQWGWYLQHHHYAESIVHPLLITQSQSLGSVQVVVSRCGGGTVQRQRWTLFAQRGVGLLHWGMLLLDKLGPLLCGERLWGIECGYSSCRATQQFGQLYVCVLWTNTWRTHSANTGGGKYCSNLKTFNILIYIYIYPWLFLDRPINRFATCL